MTLCNLCCFRSHRIKEHQSFTDYQTSMQSTTQQLQQLLLSHTLLFLFPLLFLLISFPLCIFPSRFSSVHPLSVICYLLWCAAGEGKGETTSPAGRHRASEASRWWQRKSRINRQKNRHSQTSWSTSPSHCSIFSLANCTEPDYNSQ